MIRKEVRESLPEYGLSLILSAGTVFGAFLDRGFSFANMSVLRLLAWAGISAALTIPVRWLLTLLCGVLARWARWEEAPVELPEAPTSKRGRVFLSGRPGTCFLFSLGVILACWLPVWLAYYPGLWNYDPWQAEQVITGVYSKHHPLLHTLLLGHIYRFALEKGNANLAPALYSAIQAGICAAIFALTCVLIRQRTRSKVFFVLSLLFYAVFPVHPIMAMSTTKDTLFAAMALLAGLFFLWSEECGTVQRRWLIAAEIPVLALVILLRNNAKYCFYFLILVGLLKLKKKQWRQILAVVVAGTVLGVAADRALGRLLRATPVLVAEMCSVPSQMAGRIQEKADPADAETSAFLEEFYSLHELTYNPYLADPAKKCLRLESREDLIRYIQGSLRLLRKYPAICLDSFLYTTKGLWYLWDQSHTRIYGMENRQGYMATDVQPGYQIEPDSKLPFLQNWLEKLLTNNAFLRIPILHLLFAPALYVILLLLSFFSMLRGRKNRKRLVIPVLLIFLVLTIALGPGILPRYVYPLMVWAPLLIWMAMKSAGISGRDVSRAGEAA